MLKSKEFNVFAEKTEPLVSVLLLTPSTHNAKLFSL